jgi:hypothetical protein
MPQRVGNWRVIYIRLRRRVEKGGKGGLEGVYKALGRERAHVSGEAYALDVAMVKTHSDAHGGENKGVAGDRGESRRMERRYAVTAGDGRIVLMRRFGYSGKMGVVGNDRNTGLYGRS